MQESEVLNTLILARASHFCLNAMLQLYRAAGSATAVIDNRRALGDIIRGCPKAVADALGDISEARRKAESEMEYALRSGISIICIGGEEYPQRLRECDDAPLALFYKGTGSLNRKRIISVVGTRRCTAYGQDCVARLVKGMRELCPEVLIVSGLAYGIDICAHRNALAEGLDTVAVLAHGLDYIYPPRHRDTAMQMTMQGGLLTEFFTGTNADKLNFIRRNRIVAGLADATVLVESAERGGGLITARIAESYHRDVFAFPGRVGDACSAGCNNLIRDNKAALVTSADDLVAAMRWQADAELAAAKKRGIELTLFPNLTTEEQAVVDALAKDNDQQANTLSVRTNLPIGNLAAVLLSLEMKGVVRCLAGGVYHI